MTVLKKKFIFFAHCLSQSLRRNTFVFSMVFFLSLHAQAQPIPATCDEDYYNVLTARTYLEGQREIEAAQRIILKQDSVLEYSCFHLDIDLVGQNGGIFSENGIRLSPGNPPEFDGGINIFAGDLDNALNSTVSLTLVGFLESFSHNYMGGTFAGFPPAGAGCNPMNIVWFVSKCTNFDPNWWVDLSRLATNDIRIYPEPCLGGNRSSDIATAAAASYPAPGATGGMDAAQTFVQYLTGNCSAPGNQPIRTGIFANMLIGGTLTEIEDGVCVQPGCYYNGAGSCL
jgi:hypothetical protein